MTDLSRFARLISKGSTPMNKSTRADASPESSFAHLTPAPPRLTGRAETAPPHPTATETAKAIVRAGQVRRGEIAGHAPQTDTLAEQIIVAGKKRRNEV